jgi:hypothetical protein
MFERSKDMDCRMLFEHRSAEEEEGRGREEEVVSCITYFLRKPTVKFFF